MDIMLKVFLIKHILIKYILIKVVLVKRIIRGRNNLIFLNIICFRIKDVISL